MLSVPTAGAQPTGEWAAAFGLPGVAGPVTALAETDDRLYVGGQFFYAGNELAVNIAAFEKATGQWTALGYVIGEGVNALAVDADGVVYVGGRFDSVAGVPAANVARYDPVAGEWEPLGAGLDGEVAALAIGPGGSLYAGGRFELAGGSASGIARWDGTRWSRIGDLGENSSEGATSLAFDGDVLYVGGSFSIAGGVQTENIARYDLATSAWFGLGGGVDRDGLSIVGVDAIAVGEDGVYAGGTFSEALQPDGSTLAVNNIARWDPEMETWSTLGEGTEFLLTALAFGPDGGLYAGGEWSEDVLRRWDGKVWTPVDPGPAGIHPGRLPRALLSSSNRLYIGFLGYFFFEGNNPQDFLYTYEPDADRWGVLGSDATDGLSDDVFALETSPDAEVYAGGTFRFAGTEQIDVIARWDGTAWNPLGQGVSRVFEGVEIGRVEALLYRDDGLYVGGLFDEAFQADGTPLASKSVARWTGEQWEALGGGLALGTVRALAENEDGTVYVGGRFLEVVQGDGERLAVESLARWNPGTARWEAPPEGHDFDGVYSFAVDEAGALYVGGYRTVDGTGESRARVVRLDPQTEQWTTVREWGEPSNPAFGVEDLAAVGDPTSDGALYAAVLERGVWRWQDDVWERLEGPAIAYSLALNGDPEAGGALYAGVLGGELFNPAPPYLQQWDGRG